MTPDTCPKCKLAYSEFRTGYTFHDIYMMLWSRDRKTRHTVLGKWREIKLSMFAEHVQQCGGPSDDSEIEPWEY